MEDKYNIEIRFSSNRHEHFVGLGRPSSSDKELFIKDVDGTEIIVNKENINFFIISKYEG